MVRLHFIAKIGVTVDAKWQSRQRLHRAAPDRALATCVATVVKNAVFAKTKAGGAFIYPFVV